ncbi:MAG TPA: DUF1552 domain-containing protein [Polyangiaceae bacterium]|nr:DUF1552 domain-containing protein [Polyangiaceae bacterium]
MSRRQALCAAGVAVGLPWLESLLPRSSRAQTAAPVKRFAALFFPNGSTMREDWQLGGSGSNYTMGTAHTPLLPLQSSLSMFQNLNGTVGGAPDHSRGTAEFLTGTNISNMTTPEVSISIDQAIADALDPNTAIRSLHLGPTPYPAGPPSDTGWPSGYNVYVSWSSPTTPNAPLESAQVAFDQVFVPSGDPTADALAQKRLRLRQSILDHVDDQILAITPRLGADDAAKLDEYLTSVRDVESRLQVAPATPMSGCGGATGPGDNLNHPDHTKAMLDVLVLALRCDATRVATYSMDYGFGNKDFNFLGLGSFRHHNLSHSGTTPGIINSHKAIVTWYMEQIAYFLGAMQAVDDGGVSLLDNSVLFIGSDVGDGWSHSHAGLPVMVAGGGAGALNPGRLIDGTGVTYTSVLLALAQAMDANLPSFAGETTPFAGL